MRPIFEPNLERTDAALGYDKNQLQRRPAPFSDAGGYPYIYRIKSSAAPQVIEADGAGEAIVFDIDDNDEGTTYFSMPNTSTTRILAQGSGSKGLYRFTMAAKWDPVFDDDASMRITVGAFGWSPQVYFREIYGPTGPHDQNGVMTLHFTARIYTTASSDCQLQVNHGSASTQDIIQAFLEIAFLGTWEGNAEGTFEFVA